MAPWFRVLRRRLCSLHLDLLLLRRFVVHAAFFCLSAHLYLQSVNVMIFLECRLTLAGLSAAAAPPSTVAPHDCLPLWLPPAKATTVKLYSKQY